MTSSPENARPDETPHAATWPVLRRMFGEMVRPYTVHLIVAGLCMALTAASTAGTAWLMDPVVNKVFIARDASLLWPIGAAILGVFAAKSISVFTQEVVINYVGQKVVANTQNRLFSHLIGHDMAMFQSRHSGRLISHFTFDVNAMRVATSNIMVSLGRDSLTLLFLIGVMFYQEWSLALITLLIGPLAIYPMQVIGQRMRRFSSATQEEMGSLTSHLAQCFQSIKLIQASAAEKHERARIAELVEMVFQLTFRAARVRASAQPLIDMMGGLAVAAVIVYGGHRVIDGATTPGAFFSFITAALMAYQPLRALSKLSAHLQEGLAAAERVFAVLDTPATITNPSTPHALPPGPGPIAFENVTFSYDGENTAIRDVSFTAEAGRVTALVGPSGAGKSTIFELIPRFFDVGAGAVRVNGVDVRDLDKAVLRNALAIVSQDIMLFDDSVLNNIRYGRMDASDDEVRAAAEAAAANLFIGELPEGYQTIIGERGVRLSGGQRQRIAIARAILKDAPFLLLDEATSALDSQSERQIQNALASLMVGRTTLVIAHRLSTIADADMILVFNEGRIIESGSHGKLMAKEGLFARLSALQSHEDSVENQA